MNQKGFGNNIVLVVSVIILVGVLGYVTLVRKSVSTPTEQPQTNNSQNTQATTPSPANNIVSQTPPTLTKDQIMNGYDECGRQFRNGVFEADQKTKDNPTWDAEYWNEGHKDCALYEALNKNSLVFADLDGDGVLEVLVQATIVNVSSGVELYVFKNVNGVAHIVAGVPLDKEYKYTISANKNAVSLDGKNFNSAPNIKETVKEIYKFINGKLIKQFQTSIETPTGQTITLSPASGVAGSMVTWNGYYSFCGVNVDPSVCTEDRFNQLVFIQNGTVVASNIEGYLSTSQKSNYEAIQIPTTLSPGVYQLAMQNCFGKGCRNNNLATFTVVAQNQTTAPTILSVSPSSINDLTTTVTIRGSGFTQSNNYISFMSTGVDNTNPYNFISKASSSDGNTITFQFPSCYASTPPTCGSFAYGASQFAISNVNGTSNYMPFMLLVQPFRFK